MPSTTTQPAPDWFVGLAFPVIRVRYAGATDHRQSRYIATLRGVRHTENYDHALDGSRNAYNAAAACWVKYRAAHAEAYKGDSQRRVFIPGDLDADSYSYTVVPDGFLTGTQTYEDAEPETAPAAPDAETETAGTVTVTRTDYPGAPMPGDRFGWVIAAANGAHMTEPYRNQMDAERLRNLYAREAHLAFVALDWPAA